MNKVIKKRRLPGKRKGIQFDRKILLFALNNGSKQSKAKPQTKQGSRTWTDDMELTPDPVLERGYAPISSEGIMQISHHKQWQLSSMNYAQLLMKWNYILVSDFQV